MMRRSMVWVVVAWMASLLVVGCAPRLRPAVSAQLTTPMPTRMSSPTFTPRPTLVPHTTPSGTANVRRCVRDGWYDGWCRVDS
jgi:hypothetical protein